MREIWKDIKDYEGLYQVSNFGRVRSLGKGKTHKTSRIRKLSKNNVGYLVVSLCKDGKVKTYLVHRLVTEAFLYNPDNLTEVNHIDEDKTNNFVGTPENDYKDGNLEWCNREYNNNYGTRTERFIKVMSKTVLQFTKYGEFIREWSSTRECERNGFYSGAVCSCCNGKRKTHKGYIWRYK